MSWNKVAVIGVGMTKFGELFDKSWEALLADAYVEALGNVDKGIKPSEIQAVYYGTTMGSLMGMELPGGAIVSTLLGLTGVPVTRIENGCPTGSDTFRNAALAVASGVFDVVLAIGAVFAGIRVLEKLAPSRHTCPKCGKPLAQGTTPCPHCGTELSWERKAA